MKSFSDITKAEEERALRIHREAIVVDTCVCPVPHRYQFERVVQGGVTAAAWTIADTGHDLGQAIRDIAQWYAFFNENGDQITPVTSPSDILEAKKQGKCGIIFAFQDPKPIENLALLEVFHRLGVRMIQLTYNERSLIGDGASEATDRGLSDFGRKVVHEMNRLHMLIDVSHCGRRTTIETAELSKDPVVCSHANPKALCKSARNKTDEELRLVAEKGGVVAPNAYGPLIWSREKKQPTIDDYLNQIDYEVKLVGVDHVGIGSDLVEGDYVGEAGELRSANYRARYPEVVPSWFTNQEMSYPRDLNRYAQIPNITKGLVGRGYSEEDTKKILGGNSLKLFQSVWK